MGNITSPATNKVIQAQFTAPKSGTVRKATRVFRQGHDVVIELSPGHYVAAQLSGYNKNALWVYPTRGHYWLIDALAAFGHITKEEMTEHKRIVDARWLEEDKKYDMEQLDGYAKKYGFELTPEQLKKLKPAAKKKAK